MSNYIFQHGKCSGGLRNISDHGV